MLSMSATSWGMFRRGPERRAGSWHHRRAARCLRGRRDDAPLAAVEVEQGTRLAADTAADGEALRGGEHGERAYAINTLQLKRDGLAAGCHAVDDGYYISSGRYDFAILFRYGT